MKRSKSGPAGSPHLSRLSLPAVHPNEPFVGAAILDELPLARAPLFCEAYRCVASWAAAKPAERAELFAAGAAERVRGTLERTPGLTPEVRGALETVCGLLADAGAITGGRVADACLRIAEWAEAHEAPETAFRFVQAAGRCAGKDAGVAYRAGCMARQRGIWQLAELWFRHAVAVARHARDHRAQALGYIGLGNSYYRQGKFPAARREHLKALRVGRRHGLRQIQGMALHDLFLVAVETREFHRAEEYARAAFEAYGPDHPTIPALAHDIAFFWNTQGFFARALPVFVALVPHLHDPEDRLRVLASSGRAAGGSGSRTVFEEMSNAVWDQAESMEGTAAWTSSLMELAQGALSLGAWSHTARAAEGALKAALRRGEVDIIESARGLLAAVESGRSADAGEPRPSAQPASEADALAAELVRSLRAGVGA